MRKRLGALHSDDCESFIEVVIQLTQLSKAATGKIGVFYDENSIGSHRFKKPIRPNPQQDSPKTPFSNFQFNRSDQWRFDESKTTDRTIHTLTAMLILAAGPATALLPCSGTPSLHSTLLSTHLNNTNHTVDLAIHNVTINHNEQLIIKVWINYKPEAELFKVYYQEIDTYFVAQQLRDQVEHRIRRMREGKETRVIAIQNVQSQGFSRMMDTVCGDGKWTDQQ